MNDRKQGRLWARTARLTILAVAVAGLAGCVAGYSYVQPGVGGAGGYYTGDTAYPAGYGDGYYGGYYGGYGYGTTVSIGIGYGGYGWPGYYGGYGYYPGYYGYRHGGGWHHDRGGYHGAQRWPQPATPMPAPQSRGFAPPMARPAPAPRAPGMRFNQSGDKRR